jgi:protein SSD1
LQRADLRKERIFSIDPPTARDLDDAVSIKALIDGTYELGVHIADVSYFVSPGTEVDAEAYNRATSVYLVQKVIPMLPRLLCEELCSLNPGVDRLAFSVFWNIDSDAKIIGEPRFTRSVINSCAKLWYDHAQAVIEDRDWNQVNPVTLTGDWTDDQVHEDIRLLHKLSLILRARRYEGGALTLNSIKLWFKLDEVGNPVNSGTYEQKDANRLIEEVNRFL